MCAPHRGGGGGREQRNKSYAHFLYPGIKTLEQSPENQNPWNRAPGNKPWNKAPKIKTPGTEPLESEP